MNVPDHLRYTRDHEWVEMVDGKVRMGVTDYAQDALGDVVFVQVPTVGVTVQVGTTFSEVESTKSVSDIYGPIDGTVTEVNGALTDSPQRINEDPYGEGWICVIQAADDPNLDHLLDAPAYKDLVGEV